MKKTLAAIAASIVTASMAAGPFDGIYQSTTASNLYLSVHQNSSSIIVAAFATIPPTGHDYTENGYRFQPQRSDIWDLNRPGNRGGWLV